MENYKTFTLIVCTYMRPKALLNLLKSVEKQTLYPNEILIIDGSINDDTHQALQDYKFQSLHYFKVDSADRGLTRQRNFGIKHTHKDSEVICFLDDDIVLEPDYFEKLIGTYNIYPEALGVGGYIIEESDVRFVGYDYKPKMSEYYFDGWVRTDAQRYVVRKKFGLDADCPPSISPLYSHGRSVGFLPPSGKIYPAELIMGGVSSYKKEVFTKNQFSTYFEGYGLYEDADFSIRVAKTGKLYINTSAKLYHYHEASGRPNQYRYGMMVVRNGWYVWRVKIKNPLFKDKVKWHGITLLLILIRFTNVVTSAKKTEALTESIGRLVGWLSLAFNKPK